MFHELRYWKYADEIIFPTFVSKEPNQDINYDANYSTNYQR